MPIQILSNNKMEQFETEPKISRFSEIVSGMSKSEKKVVVLESCDADNLIRNEIQLQLFHRYNLAIQQGF
jgi:hypothetical protein